LPPYQIFRGIAIDARSSERLLFLQSDTKCHYAILCRRERGALRAQSDDRLLPTSSRLHASRSRPRHPQYVLCFSGFRPQRLMQAAPLSLLIFRPLIIMLLIRFRFAPFSPRRDARLRVASDVKPEPTPHRLHVTRDYLSRSL
jgi:hypothetical protein